MLANRRRFITQTAGAVALTQLLRSPNAVALAARNFPGKRPSMQSNGQHPALNEQQIEQMMQSIVASFRMQPRSPVLASPADEHLEYEDVTFASEDGVRLDAWFIPRKDSRKLVIVNHPRGFNRYGFPSNIEPWKSMFAIGGNDFEVNYVRDYRILHDAGYNVLTYDERNAGHSGMGSGGMCTSGMLESRDVVGSILYAQSRSDIRDMTVGLFSRCLGCNSTLQAMARRPAVFSNVRCLVGCQPVSPNVIMEQYLALAGVPAAYNQELARRIRLVTSYRLADQSVTIPAKKVMIPTFLYQIHDDVLTRPSDVQTVFDNIPIGEKELYWIWGSTRRWDGYLAFSKDPSKMLGWLSKYMA